MDAASEQTRYETNGKRTSPYSIAPVDLDRKGGKGSVTLRPPGLAGSGQVSFISELHCYKYPFPVTIPAVAAGLEPLNGGMSIHGCRSSPLPRLKTGNSRPQAINRFDDVYHMIRSDEAHDWSIDSPMMICSVD